ncbi:hypothetical protein A4D02_34280 [Niastella koreensis]|uniref:NTF2 fold domain-containing protein n=2 Tax=Niastella koreensis TaxID=354356 RepID=G8TDE4_NIAKG|nr:YbbC/YhhH family protein [Niastella koreensis]AEV99384.1 hypothetical protein Niako_3054 [Niastella koreensis GR20-10]OQP45238.1 hypothetical protein A4D02_34280 [Niastella koreensis]
MKVFNLMAFFILLLVCSTSIYSNLIQNKNEKRDYVPDAETAIKVAEAVWLPIYGNRIYNEKPFIARLENNKVWIVEGTLKGDSVYNSKPNPNSRSIFIVVGGVAHIEIQKSDCKILQVSHGK